MTSPNLSVYTPPPASALNIFYVDAALIVVSKPAGLLSVPGRGAEKQDCLTHRLQQDFPNALNVHRLDMETSGLMAFARNAVAHRALSMAFAERRVEKRYQAIVSGCIAEHGDITLPLITDWPNRPLQKVDFTLGKPSHTRFQRLHYDEVAQISRVLLEPITGRSHQLRLHLCAIGHPILGDKLYAPPTIQALSSRLQLHAEYLSLPHPVQQKILQFTDPSPF